MTRPAEPRLAALTRRSFAAATGAALVAPAALAQSAAEFPSKPVRLVVPFAAGSATDIVARVLGARLQDAWKQPVVVDNKPGANGMLASEQVARAPADGYTLILATNTTHAANPSLFKIMPYDPVKDFEPVSMVLRGVNVLLVNPAIEAKTVGELTALAKARPGKLNFAAASASQRLSGEMYRQLAGVDIVHVPYKASPQAMQDLIAGTVEIMFSDAQNAIPQIRAGKVRALAVTSPQRTPVLPDLPSMAEAGVAGYELTWWMAVYAPAGTPKPVVEGVSARIRDLLAQKDAQDQMAAASAEIRTSTPAELAAFTRSEIERWAKAIKAAGIEPE